MVTKEGLWEETQQRCVDIIEHLPTLQRYSQKVQSILEIGVRDGHSTIAFLMAGCPKLTSVDIALTPRAQRIKQAAPSWDFQQEDSRTFKPTQQYDLLFIDTWHTHDQVKAELESLHSFINTYIILHDTVTFGDSGEDGGIGLNPAISKFMEEHKEWVVEEQFINNNGLLVLKKVTNV